MRLGRRQSVADERKKARELLMDGNVAAHLSFTAKAADRFPDDADLRLEHAVALQECEPERARSEALEAVRLADAGDPVLLTRAAGLLLALGDVANAKVCTDAAVQVGSANELVASKLSSVQGQIAVRQGEVQVAEMHLRAAHEADPLNAFYARDLAAVIATAGRFGEALSVIDQAMAGLLGVAKDHAHRDREMLGELRLAVERSRRKAEGTGTEIVSGS
jgi:Flp pilus assembly protein TadD